MPRTKLDKFSRPSIQPNYLAEYFKAAIKAHGLTAESFADIIGVSRESVSRRLRMPTAEWNLGEIKTWCEKLEIPFQNAAEVILFGAKQW